MDGKQKKDGGDEFVEVVMTSDEDVTSAVSHDDSDHDDSDPGTSLSVAMSAVESLGRPTPQQAIGWSPDHMLGRDTDTGDIIPFGSPSPSPFPAIHFPSTTVDSILGVPVPVALGFEDHSGTGSSEDYVWDGDSDDERQAGFLASYHAQWDGQSASETTSETEWSSGLFEAQSLGDESESEWDSMLIAHYEAHWDREEQSERDVFASSLARDEEMWDGLSDDEYEFASSLASYEELWDGLSDIECEFASPLASYERLFDEVEYEFPVQLWGRDDQREWDSGSHGGDSGSVYYGDDELASRDLEEGRSAVGETIDSDEERDMQTVASILTSATALEDL
ncbi:hypothetical protein PC9H_008676 [Pleurotus ostreatus]|uniref:Uncharacterized protein n=2 Tax=Pleurotus TaxID=5320 RepID=A0A8H6ZP81_PLEOS|nr:uncharacterized protein PC9H_010222 [Pleurotus ostreatus]XP_036629612.1 uncharacterized protein PC9H_008676 [Pleurotus ostreatus]KAG9221741.1 hypothetical protein CCMSSC00406_0006684 [Pleurotus cornucopiae]KAF7424911.1 hypothetical protein PC9H_010222 [Pleurotus ostreatus]KAF7426308.1 hypothetical protein PC9H_008676 [Pleurotus ostreatus]KAJ8692062.1 hypothetical protein PTI98_009403 [Pleurotus ostreatus]KAJ8693809.1 hypothetical protein PTI98_008766 [Pleurotus ostreatus]